MNLNVYLKACLYISDMSRYKSVWDKVSSSDRIAVIFSLNRRYRLEYLALRCKIGYLTVTVRSEYFDIWVVLFPVFNTPSKNAKLNFNKGSLWKIRTILSLNASWRKNAISKWSGTVTVKSLTKNYITFCTHLSMLQRKLKVSFSIFFVFWIIETEKW